MNKNTFMITGEINRLKYLASQMEKELFKPTNEEDIDLEAIEKKAEEASDCVNNLIDECME